MNKSIHGLHPVQFGRGLASKKKLSDFAAIDFNRIAIIADDHVAKLYSKQLFCRFLSGFENFKIYTFRHGEKNKTRRVKEEIEDAMLQDGLGKDTLLLGFGGGVTTDIAGYIAATYCRGIALILIPTSLLAMADAALSGKNGVNTPFGKNLIGTIYQPHNVIVDPEILNTLRDKEYLDGLTEIVKHAIIYDRALFEFIEKNAEKLSERDSNFVDHILFRSIEIKMEIALKDANEKGYRQILNYGHTVGHALEAASLYQLSHGVAVAIGMMVESRLAEKLGYLSTSDSNRIDQLIKRLNLFSYQKKIPKKAFFNAIKQDKKALSNEPRFVMVDKIGSALDFDGQMCKSIGTDHLKEIMNDLLID